MDKEFQGIMKTKDSGVIFIDTRSIQFIEIINPDLMWDILTDDLSFEIPVNGEVSKLALNRAIEESKAHFLQKYEIKLDCKVFESGLGDKSRSQMKVFLDALKKALTEIGKDEMGVEALGLIKVVNVIEGDEKVEKGNKAENEVTIKLNLNKKLPSTLDIDLIEILEKLLLITK